MKLLLRVLLVFLLLDHDLTVVASHARRGSEQLQQLQEPVKSKSSSGFECAEGVSSIRCWLIKSGNLIEVQHAGYSAPLLLSITAMIVNQIDKTKGPAVALASGCMSVVMLCAVLLGKVHNPEDSQSMALSVIPIVLAYLTSFLVTIYHMPKYGVFLLLLLMFTFRALNLDVDSLLGGNSAVMRAGKSIHSIGTSDWLENKSLLLPLVSNLLVFTFFGLVYYGIKDDFEDDNFTSLSDAVYMSAITHTTVGFGEYSAKRRRGRVMTMLHMFLQFILFSAAVWASFVKWQGDLVSEGSDAALARCINRCERSAERDKGCKLKKDNVLEIHHAVGHAFMRIVGCFLTSASFSTVVSAHNELTYAPKVSPECGRQCSHVCTALGDGHCWLEALCGAEIRIVDAEERLSQVLTCLKDRCIDADCRAAVVKEVESRDKKGKCMGIIFQEMVELPEGDRFLPLSTKLSRVQR
jgi:uncharacterized membrane protein YhdT